MKLIKPPQKLFDLMAIHTEAMSSVGNAAAMYDVSVSEAVILMAMAKQRELYGDLSIICSFSNQKLGYNLCKLECGGLIKRHRNRAGSGSKMIVTITKKGASVRNSLIKDIEEIMNARN